jgi:phosphomannomutase
MAATTMPVSKLIGQIPRYQIVKTKFPCRREDAERAVAALTAKFADQRLDLADGIRIDWPDAWVHARPSNTEPIMRIIAEAPDQEAAQNQINLIQTVVRQALGI